MEVITNEDEGKRYRNDHVWDVYKRQVQNGCDAVYLGGSMFGARAFANNFDEDEIQEAIAYAHVYGVRVFVTVNTLIREEEFEDCVRYVQFLYEHDVDAVIIQDLGLFSVLRQRFPDMELHASTQMHIHNPQGIHFIESCGCLLYTSKHAGVAILAFSIRQPDGHGLHCLMASIPV